MGQHFVHILCHVITSLDATSPFICDKSLSFYIFPILIVLLFNTLLCQNEFFPLGGPTSDKCIAIIICFQQNVGYTE